MSAVHKFTESQVIDSLRAVAEERPDHVYERPAHMDGGDVSCYYVHTDAETDDPVTPGCGVGVALHRLGLPLEDLAKCEGEAADTVVERLCAGGSYGEAAQFALTFQSCQDNGDTWADSLSAAEQRS